MAFCRSESEPTEKIEYPVTMKIQQLTVGMMSVCCYIISCEKTGKAAIIDPVI